MENTTVTIRYDMLAAASATMTTVYARLRDREIQQLIHEIDDIRRNYLDAVTELRSECSDQLQIKMLQLQKLLNGVK